MAALQICVRSGQVIVVLGGELDVTGAAEVAAAVVASATPGQPVIVDLDGLDFIDCSALAALVAAQRRVRRDGGDVLLAAPRGLVLQMLTLTGLDSVFGVYRSVIAASAGSSERGGRPCGASRVPERTSETFSD